MTPLHYNAWLEYYEKGDNDTSRVEWLEYKQDMEDDEGDYLYHLRKEEGL